MDRNKKNMKIKRIKAIFVNIMAIVVTTAATKSKAQYRKNILIAII